MLRATRSFGAATSGVNTASADFSSSSLSASDLSSLRTREVSRGQEQEVFDQLAEELARKIYNEAVSPDF